MRANIADNTVTESRATDALASANRFQRAAQVAFGLGMASVGVLTLVYGYAVLLFQPLPAWVPWRNGLGYVSGIIMLGTGAGLLFERTARLSIRILLAYLLIWLVSRLPAPVSDPGREITWFAVGEVAVPTAAALVLFARLAGLRERSRLQIATRRHAVRIAWVLFGLSLPTYGLSHFFEFAARTVSLLPSWLPYKTGWAWLAGAGQIAAGLGVLFGVFPRWAATAEAAMLSLFTMLVWVPAVFANPGLRSNWVELLVSGALAAAAWVVAESIPAGRRGRTLPGVARPRIFARPADDPLPKTSARATPATVTAPRP